MRFSNNQTHKKEHIHIKHMGYCVSKSETTQKQQRRKLPFQYTNNGDNKRMNECMNEKLF